MSGALLRVIFCRSQYLLEYFVLMVFVLDAQTLSHSVFNAETKGGDKLCVFVYVLRSSN